MQIFTENFKNPHQLYKTIYKSKNMQIKNSIQSIEKKRKNSKFFKIK